MKELSIEEKAKAYDKALRYAMIYYKEGNEDMKMMMKTCFPALVEESEDGRIRKELIEFTKTRGGFKKEWIAWLEKQGKEDSSIQQAYEWGYTEGKRIERKHWVEKQKFSEDYNSIDPQFGKPIEQNPAWSEKDEKILKAIHNSVDVECLSKNELDYVVMVDWFNALKDRVQPKQEWSEEDKRMFDYALDMIEWYSGRNEDKSRLVSDWLKSLKQRIGG